MTSKKVLFIENFKIFESWASKTYPFKCNEIKKDNKFDVFEIGVSNISDYKVCDYKAILLGWHGVCVNKYYTTKRDFYGKYVQDLETKDEIECILQEFFNWKLPVYAIVQDLHNEDYLNGLDGFALYLKHFSLTGIITPYLKTKNVRYVQERVPNLEVLWLPHHIDHTKFCGRNNVEKKYDILLFGNDHPKYYPFRHRVISLLESEQVKEYGFKVHKIPKPRNYFKYNASVSNEALSKKMNQSYLTLCTSSNLDYLLGKYFETSFSNCVVFGNMANDGVGIWKDNYININETMTDKEILCVLSDCLTQKEKLKSMSETMTSVMHEKFRLCDFSQHLYDLFLE